MHSDHCNLATACFGVWSLNNDLATALRCYAQAGAFYARYRWGQGSLYPGPSVHGVRSLGTQCSACTAFFDPRTFVCAADEH
jgi:hypothetical protein